ncbi:CinA family protein [Nocardioides sp. GXQ0305]|uniref:CinA family protein n=1 Tax=Nocardioides sp. GXQ0305 TaxID=3423912 RepID=UPI003D7EB58C
MSMHAGELVEDLARRLTRHRLTLAVADSVTGGRLAHSLESGPDAERWFRGGVRLDGEPRDLGGQSGRTERDVERLAVSVAGTTAADVGVAMASGSTWPPRSPWRCTSDRSR